MKVKDLRLYIRIVPITQTVVLDNQEKFPICRVLWGKYARRTKRQAISIANRLCDRFNAGQEGK